MASKVWFITGTSSGFGRALCEAALDRGDRVFATARNLSTIADIGSRWPGNAHISELDVTVASSIEKAVEEAVAVFGGIDVLVNNAGYGLVGSLEETSNEQIQRNFNVNFFGALNLIRAALPQFRNKKSGHVINISAAAAIVNYPGFGIYGAAKCALEGMSESLAAEGRSFGLRVTIVEPGPFRTDFISRSLEHASSDVQEYHGSAGKFAKFIAGIDGKQPGDPVKAAQQILQVVDAEKPPLRLVLGKYAIDKTRRSLAQRETELTQWEACGLAADGAPT